MWQRGLKTAQIQDCTKIEVRSLINWSQNRENILGYPDVTYVTSSLKMEEEIRGENHRDGSKNRGWPNIPNFEYAARSS